MFGEIRSDKLCHAAKKKKFAKVCTVLQPASCSSRGQFLTLKKGREGERKEGRKEKGERESPKKKKNTQRKEKPWLKLNLPPSVV